MDSKRFKKPLTAVFGYVAGAVITIIITAIVKGEPLSGLVGVRRLLQFLQTSIPLWTLLVALAVCVGVITAFPWAKRKPSPKLHVSWDRSHCVWGIARSAGEQTMQIMGWAVISSEGTDEMLIIREAYLSGTKPVMNLVQDLTIKPGTPLKCMIATFVKPVIIADTEPLSAPMILVDHKNRKYFTPTVTFRPASGPRQTKAESS